MLGTFVRDEAGGVTTLMHNASLCLLLSTLSGADGGFYSFAKGLPPAPLLLSELATNTHLLCMQTQLLRLFCVGLFAHKESWISYTRKFGLFLLIFLLLLLLFSCERNGPIQELRAARESNNVPFLSSCAVSEPSFGQFIIQPKSFQPYSQKKDFKSFQTPFATHCTYF